MGLQCALYALIKVNIPAHVPRSTSITLAEQMHTPAAVHEHQPTGADADPEASYEAKGWRELERERREADTVISQSLSKEEPAGQPLLPLLNCNAWAQQTCACRSTHGPSSSARSTMCTHGCLSSYACVERHNLPLTRPRTQTHMTAHTDSHSHKQPASWLGVAFSPYL